MAEKETIFSSKVEYNGFFSFKDFYKFCHAWLKEETGLDLIEDKYEEKLAGDLKELIIDWTGTKEITDYFKYEIKINFKARRLKEVEIQKAGAKVKTNEGSIAVTLKGTLVRDYEGKFEKSAGQKFMRSIYEKWVIPARIEEYEGKLAEDCDEFLGQAKAYLDLEGKK